MSRPLDLMKSLLEKAKAMEKDNNKFQAFQYYYATVHARTDVWLSTGNANIQTVGTLLEAYEYIESEGYKYAKLSRQGIKKLQLIMDRADKSGKVTDSDLKTARELADKAMVEAELYPNR